MTIRGETLLALAGRMSMTEAQAAEARRFMRALLEHHLGDRHRHIRDLLEKVARPLARASATRAEVGT